MAIKAKEGGINYQSHCIKFIGDPKISAIALFHSNFYTKIVSVCAN